MREKFPLTAVLNLVHRDGKLMVRPASFGQEVSKDGRILVFDAGRAVVRGDRRMTVKNLCPAAAADIERLTRGAFGLEAEDPEVTAVLD